MITYRTIVLRYCLSKKLIRELEKQDLRLRALMNLAVRGYIIYPPDLSKTLLTIVYRRNHVKNFRFGKVPKRWFCKIPLTCTVLRIINGARRGDTSAPVIVDLDKGVIKLRYIFNRTLTLKLDRHVLEWIKERISENADIKIARIYVEEGKLNIALTFERNIPKPYNPESILAIDVNSWKHGITWGLIKNGKLITWSRERPDLGYIERLYNEIIHLEKIYGKMKRLGTEHTLKGRKIRKEIKNKRSKLYRYLRDYVNKLVHKFIVKALRNRSKIIIDDVLEESRRQLLEELLDNGLAKIYLAYLRRFVKLLENQAKWYGIPFEKRRLPSKICPKCRIEMIENGHRKLKCPHCGQEYDRDLVPILHAREMVYCVSCS